MAGLVEPEARHVVDRARDRCEVRIPEPELAGRNGLPERDPRHYYEPAVEAVAESGIAVEVSTAGLRKPVGELYPARAFAEMCVEAGAPFASIERHSIE